MREMYLDGGEIRARINFGGATVAMLALNSDTLADSDAIGASILELLPDSILYSTGEPGSFNLEAADESAFISLFPEPLEWSILEDACADCRHWPDASKRLRNHSTHVFVMSRHERGDIVAQSMLVTKITAALIACNDAAGVYWATAPLVTEPITFRDRAIRMTRESLPLDIWIDFQVSVDDFGFIDGITRGLEPFAQCEIEFCLQEGDASEVEEVLQAAAHHLLSGGQLNDGETITFRRGETFTIRHYAPDFGPHATVIELSRVSW
jgi:hypothetical protein